MSEHPNSICPTPDPELPGNIARVHTSDVFRVTFEPMRSKCTGCGTRLRPDPTNHRWWRDTLTIPEDEW